MKKIYFLLLTLLVFRLAWYFLVPDQRYQPGRVVSLQAVLDREPEISIGKQLLRVAGLVVYAPLVPELHFGDRVEIAGTVGCSQRGQDCQRMGIYKPTVKIVGEASFDSWTTAAFTIRTRFVDVYQNILDRDQANLLSGVVLGSLGLDQQFRNKLANVGLTHIVAASGMNISLFSGFVLWVMSVIRLKKIYKALLTIVAILFYSTVTGFEPPIVRAAIMAIVSVVGLLLGRQRTGIAALLAAAYLMLWASPGLLTSASFLLSFSAMMGQIISSSMRISLPEILKALIENVLQSSVAILATFPIVMMFFAKFSLVSVFTNTLVLWTVEPLMILGAIAGILGMVSPGWASFLALPIGVLLSYFLWVVDVFGKNEKWLLRVTGVNWAFSFGYYFVLAAMILWWRQRGGKKGQM